MKAEGASTSDFGLSFRFSFVGSKSHFHTVYKVEIDFSPVFAS